ncbi:conserved hypothetical protein [Leishmania mexicana MHOM/GT/2001/U1103]|uniref:Uncharacterized protein n=1 Tax=Leishmania mexicana (strain MHOM/GT/2001/U1103) TaxID=929439 RepID=E9B0K1_LEIMU|nr:conserved hypothetical protein [Leishmania mexicana MHOM/GT/2001/U1103]CBZ28756.1 conserved hypothetical protein [Leishmania mexicana MHOM/GT/2001/U1103]
MFLRRVRQCSSRARWVRWDGIKAPSILNHGADHNDPLNAVFDEIENCDTSVHAEKRESSKMAESSGTPTTPSNTVPSASDTKVRLEEAKHKRLRRQLRDATEELDALLNESSRTTAAVSSAKYVPARAGKTFLSSAELIQEKSPQEFVALENSKAELDRLPVLRHSGCSAVVTLVGVVTEPPTSVSVALPGVNEATNCVEFAVRYDVPFFQMQTSMWIAIRTVGASLSAFAKESVGVGDVVHLLGHLVPLTEPNSKGHLCCVYVLPAGGNMSVLLKATP